MVMFGSCRLQTFDAHGKPKEVGGDEFYITFTRASTNTNTSSYIDTVTQKVISHPTYVAIPTDLGNGNYQLEFFTPPFLPGDLRQGKSKKGGQHQHHQEDALGQQQQQQDQQQEQQQENLTIFWTYTSGFGLVTQKSDWKSRGALDWVHVQPNAPLPPWKPFLPLAMPSHPLNIIRHAGVNDNGSDPATASSTTHKKLSDYEYLAVFGDSILGLFVGQYNQNQKFNKYSRQGLNFPTRKMGVHFEQNIRKPYAGNVESLKKLFADWHGPHIIEHQQEQQNRQPKSSKNSTNININTAIMLGSGNWDLGIITWNGGDEHFSIDPTLEAYRQFIEWVKTEYPTTSIYWQSGSASHPHAVALSQFDPQEDPERIAQVKKGTMYVSAARGVALEKATRTVMESLAIPVLDITRATELSAEQLFPTDAAHFRWEINRHMFTEWFY